MDERRSVPRVPVPRELAPPDPVTGARMIDLSLDGACLESAAPLAEGTELLVALPAGVPVSLPAAVAWTRLVATLRRPSGGHREVWHIGVAFAPATPDLAAAIRAALQVIQAASAGAPCP